MKMKTFQQFQEDVNPFNRQPNFGDRLRQFGNTVQSKIKQIQDNPTVSAISTTLTNDPRSWNSQFARKDLEMKLRGVNPNNPDKMPIVKSSTKINYASKHVNPTPIRRGFGGKPTTEV